jgi:hypothetical protein
MSETVYRNGEYFVDVLDDTLYVRRYVREENGSSTALVVMARRMDPSMGDWTDFATEVALAIAEDRNKNPNSPSGLPIRVPRPKPKQA